MIESAHGIILRTRPLTETSLIVHWLTRECGRLATVARGARRPRSPFLGSLDLFYEADISFNRSRRSELHILREVRLAETRVALRRDLRRLRQAAYAAAFIEQATEPETPLPTIFDLLRQFLNRLCEAGPSAPLLFAFELKLLRDLGLEPELERAGLTPDAKRIARALLDGDGQSEPRLKPARPQEIELRRFLHGFLIFHLGRLPRGRAEALGAENCP